MKLSKISLLKRGLIYSFLIFSFICCKKNINYLGDDFIDSYFRANVYTTDIKFSVTDYVNDSLITNLNFSGINNLFLGEYNYTDFGLLKSSVVTELLHPELGLFGDEIVDSVIMKIYFSKSEDSIKYYDNDKVMVIGNPKNSIGIKVNIINEEIPDSVYGITNNVSLKFNPSIKRSLLDVVNYPLNIKDITMPSVSDSGKDSLIEKSHIKFFLDKKFFQEVFDKNSNTVLTNTVFKNELKGLKIDFLDAESLFYISQENVSINVYYHNNRGTKKQYTISLNGNKTASLFDYTQSTNFSNSKLDTYTGNDMFLFGFRRSVVKMNLFENIDIKALKDSMWLINKAEIIIEPKSNEKLFPQNILIVEYLKSGFPQYILDYQVPEHYNPLGYLQDSKYTINLTGHINRIINLEKENRDLGLILPISVGPLGLVFDKNTVKLKIFYSKQDK